MKRLTMVLVALLVTVVMVLPIVAEGGKGKGKGKGKGRGGGCDVRAVISELPLQKLSKKEKKFLKLMREEEKLARDVYLSLHEQWDLRIFRQIARAEGKHMSAVLGLLRKYGLEDPAAGNPIGVFTDSRLQTLYEDLSAMGQTSVVNALTVGAAIEDVDIYDLQRALSRTDNEDIAIVYQNLMKGSRNHLRAFVGQLESRSESYEPSYLSIEEYEEIISTPKERGAVDADGEPMACRGGGGR